MFALIAILYERAITSDKSVSLHFDEGRKQLQGQVSSILDSL